MNLVQSFAIRNPCYKAGKSINVKGIILEGVGCPQASAKVFAHNRNREDCEGRCAHAFIDANDGSIIQLLPWRHRGWHCGKHPRTKLNANDTHIGIQLCEPGQIRYKKKNEIELAGDKEKAMSAIEKAYNSAVELCAFLCNDLNLNPMTDVISRKEAYDAAICSMNASPEFVWKAVGADFTMDKLREDVRFAMNKKAEAEEIISNAEPTPKKIEAEEIISNVESIPKKIEAEEIISNVEPIPVDLREEIISNVEPTPVDLEEEITDKTDVPEFELSRDAIKEESPKPKMVRVNVDNLRVRSSPGIGNNTTGKFTGVGVFAITEIQNGSGSKLGWGKLENGAGWICLDYVEML